MNRLVFSIVACLMALTNPISATDNLTISDFLITTGTTEKEFAISLDNEIAYAGFQFDLYLSEGLTITSCKAEQRLPKSSALTYSEQGDGIYRFIYADISAMNIYDVRNISGTSGTIITIKVSASANATTGNLTGYFRNVKLSKLNGEGPTYSEISFPITVVEPSTVTAKSYTRKYGEANPAFDYTVEGGSLVGEPEITCEATLSSPVGIYPIIIGKGTVKNDVVDYVNGTLTIEKAPLTIAAGNYTKKQGDPMPEFTLTYTGFKNNETETVLTKQAVVSCDANVASIPGEYTVTVSDAEANNYDISYTNGKLTVTAKMGDVNSDGEISITDAVAIVNHILGVPSDSFNVDVADLSGDGSISITDVVIVINIILGQ